MDIFENASRVKLRFSSLRGPLTVEDLWDVPLTSRNAFDLDAVAKAANTELKAAGEESFVVTKANPAKALAELRMEVVKHVIAVRLKEAEESRNRVARQLEKARLLEALSSKQDDAMRAMSDEDIKARIAAIDGAG